MRVVIAGGGTGGHLYPGLALAEEILRRDPDAEVIFMGSERGIEARVVPREGYRIKFIPTEGFVGRSLFRKFRSIVSFIKGLRLSYRYLDDIRPDIVVGSGGYVSVAPVMAAWLLSIPSVIMEQNSVPGRANRFLSNFVRAVCVTYTESMRYFPSDKVHLTGNPVRERVLYGNSEAACRIFSLKRGVFTVLVFGGSSGASAINRAMVDALQYLIDLRGQIQFLHQTGERDYELVKKAYRSYDYMGTVTPYIYQMPEAYAVADLVVSRSGATTISEICAVGKPAILIPYPHAAGDHQEMNARKLESLGAAVMIRNSELTGKRLSEEIRRLFERPDLRERMRSSAMGFGRTDAVKKIADIMSALSARDEGKGCKVSGLEEAGG